MNAREAGGKIGAWTYWGRRISLPLLLLLLLPLTSAEAADWPSVLRLPQVGILAALILLLTSLLVWVMVRLRLNRLQHAATLARLDVVEQIVAKAPVEILCFDRFLRVTLANSAASCSFGGKRPVGLGESLEAIEPGSDTGPIASLFATQPGSGDRQGHAEQSPLTHGANDHLALIEGNGDPLAIRYRLPGLASVANGAARTAGEGKEVALAEAATDRMISEFIANINHEIRTPMNAIIGYAEMLAAAEISGREKRFVETIQRSGMALVSILNDIVDLSKIQAGRLKIQADAASLQLICNGVAERFGRPAREKNLRFACEVAAELPPVFLLDGSRLEQVLQNLVDNAIKFTNRGMVWLRVDGKPIGSADHRYELLFQIQDSGRGIPPTDQEKFRQIFSGEDGNFYRHGGRGLGLTLCSRLVGMMGGEMNLSSVEGEGSIFSFRLPAARATEPAEKSRMRAKEATARGQGRGTLLIVDDMDLIKDVFIDFFSNSPFRVLTAATGQEAVELAQREHPDLIFMDLNLAGTDGRAVTAELRALPATAGIPVVVMTGHVLEQEEYTPLFDDFLQKPFRLEALKKLISRHVRLGFSGDHLPPAAVAVDTPEPTLERLEQRWTVEFERLYHQALQSGSLSAALALGRALEHCGRQHDDAVIIDFGRQLAQSAAEPDILGVERHLAKLSPLTGYRTP